MTRLLYALGLAVIWVLAWGSVTPANVVGGLAVAVLLITVAPDTWPAGRRPRIRPLAIARFAGYVLYKALESNVVVTREILTRGSNVHTGVLAVPLPGCSDGLVTLISNTIALTPGTMALEATQEPTVLYVHVLHLYDVDAARRELHQLAVMAYRAFGSDAAIAALEAQGPAGARAPAPGADLATEEADT